MKKPFLILILAALQLAVSAFAQITITDSFVFAGDLANDSSYATAPNLGSDGGTADIYWANNPITVSTTGFTSVGSDKLVGILTVFNSAATVAPLTGLTYGGVDVLTSNTVVNHSGGTIGGRQVIFYIDAPASDGDLVMTFDYTAGHIDEVGFALYALDNAATGFLDSATGSSPTCPSLDVSVGDFVVTGLIRNNNGNKTASAPYTDVDTNAGNMGGGTAYLIATADGTTAPVWTTTPSTGGTTTIAAFQAASSSGVTVPNVVGLSQSAAETAITDVSLAVGTVTTEYSPTVPSGDVISQDPAGGVTALLGASVDLVVSLGPIPQISVPNVVGLAQATAESDITGATLTMGGVASTYSPTVPAGDVISQSPAAGVSVDTGSGVSLVVSLGANPAPGGTIADIFTFHADCATLAAYSSNPGSDGGGANLYGADSPLTILTSGFTAAGSDKLVVVLSLHNSAATTAAITGLTYGGVSIYGNLVTGSTLGNSAYSPNYIFYLDSPATDGDFVITFDNSTHDIDEVGLQLFALNGLAPGTAYASETRGSGAFNPANAVTGDFVVGVAQRNNGAGDITVTNNPPYSEIDLTSGNLTSRVGYQVASASGSTAPSFSGTLLLESFAAFATATPPSSGYGTWAATNAPTTGNDPNADEDDDGVSNGVEFVVGGTISTNDLGKLPAVGDDGTNMTFTFERDQDSIDASTSVSIEVGTDLSTWPASYTVGADTGSSDAGVTVSKDDPGAGTDTVTLTVVKSPDAKKFARLKVAITP